MSDPVRDAILEAGWLGCIRWALGETSVVARFDRETGHRLEQMLVRTPRSGIEAIVDKACGVDEKRNDVLAAFVEWVTVEIWGEDEAPAKYREVLAERRAAR